jgi:hypothetical protein
MPLLVLYGILIAATPLLLFFFYLQFGRFRKRVTDLEEKNASQAAAFTREIAELKRQVVMQRATMAEHTAEDAKPTAPPATQKPPMAPLPPKPLSPVVIPPAPAEPLKPVVEQKPPAPVAPIVATPKLPEAAPSAPPAREPKPLTPTVPPSVNLPPVAATRVASTPDFLPLRASRKTGQTGQPESQPRPTLREQVRKISALEETLGTNWLTKLGISLLAIGLSLFGIWELQAMGPSGRAALLFVVALLLLLGGVALEKREKYELLGRAGIGGGWALLFFTTFGIYHVQGMHVLDSLVLDSALMLGVALAMAAHTLRYRSQFVTGLAFLLAYTTVALSYSEVHPFQVDGVSQVTVYGLLAGVMLSIGLIAIVQKMGWFQLEVFVILSTYLNHMYWLFRILGIDGAHGRHFPEYTASTAMLFFYWLAFRVSHVIRHTKTDFEEHISTTAAILNSALVLGALRFQSVHPELAYLALLIVGVVELGFGQAVKRRREAFVVLTVMGAALLLAAAPSHYAGQSREVAILWLVGTEVFLITGVLVKEVVFQRIGLITGLLVAVRLWFSDLSQMAAARRHSDEVLLAAGILFAVCAVVFYTNVFVLGTRKRKLFERRIDDGLLTVHSYIGGLSAAAAACALFTRDWTAAALALVMLTLAALSRSFPSQHLQVQYAAMGLATLVRALIVNLHWQALPGEHLKARLITLPVVAAAFYVTAKLALLHDGAQQRALRGFFAACGTILLGLLIWSEMPDVWCGAGLVAFALALAAAMRAFHYPALGWHANIVGVLAWLITIGTSYRSEQRFFGAVSLRIVTITLAAAGLYLLARVAASSERWKIGVAHVHSFAAAFLLALLAWYEAPNGWLAPLWATFALVLALIDLRWKRDELRWQAHALSLLALGRCIVFNLHLVATWHGFSVRLLSLAIVAVIFNALSQIVRLPAKWREQEMHHAYSWAASTLISLMLWFELQPLSIAVGWAVFGLVLFEYGLFGRVVQFRYQAYVALTASFVRIFFANLNANGRAGDFWGPRMYTVMPMVLIFFFVYAQLPEEGTTEDKAGGTERDRRLRFNVLLAWLGTVALAALFYFQFPVEWVVTSWAAMSLALFAAAYWLERPIFVLQGLAMAVWTVVRGLAHNVYGSGYFREHDWQGRYMVLSSAAALLLASLAFAFPLRDRYRVEQKERGIRRAIQLMASRPEQAQFFAAILLLTLMLALKLNAGMVTVAWGIEGVVVILLALAVGERSFRLTGLGLLLLCVGKVLAMDAWRLEPRERYITFIIVGAALLVVSYLYTRYRETIRQFL